GGVEDVSVGGVEDVSVGGVEDVSPAGGGSAGGGVVAPDEPAAGAVPSSPPVAEKSCSDDPVWCAGAGAVAGSESAAAGGCSAGVGVAVEAKNDGSSRTRGSMPVVSTTVSGCAVTAFRFAGVGGATFTESVTTGTRTVTRCRTTLVGVRAAGCVTTTVARTFAGATRGS